MTSHPREMKIPSTVVVFFLPLTGQPSSSLVVGSGAEDGEEELGNLSSIEPTAGPSGIAGQFPMQSTGERTLLVDDPSTCFMVG